MQRPGQRASPDPASRPPFGMVVITSRDLSAPLATYGLDVDAAAAAIARTLDMIRRDPESARRFGAALAGEIAYMGDHLEVRSDGEMAAVGVQVAPLRDGAGRLASWAISVRDTTHHVNLEGTHAALYMHGPDGMYTLDLEGTVQSVNPRLEHMVGQPGADLCHTALADLVAPEASLVLRGSLADAAAGQANSCEAAFQTSAGLVPVELTHIPVFVGGRVTAICGMARDVSERKRVEESAQLMAYQDPLTGLPNRRLFLDRLNLELAHARRGRQSLGVMFLDLDNFKQVNDTVGHSQGDLLLQEVAERLRQCVRESDTVARMGGDEFTLLLPGLRQHEDAAVVIRKINSALNLPLLLAGHEFHITASMGIAIFPTDGTDAETLLQHADTAMYRAKDLGKNSFQFFTAGMNQAAMERLVMESGLRRALERGELVLHYQPQVAVETGQIVGVETLVRWQHPERGLIPPGAFIPVAEDSGLIMPIGDWVLQTAIRQARSWQDAGYSPLRMAVNLSARQFQQQDLVGQVQQMLRDSGLAPGWLELEITESTAMNDVTATIRILHALRAAGVHVAVDDFGTGYSSLAYLKQFPITSLKLDRSFMRGVGEGTADGAIVTTVGWLARFLRLRAVAEGVETREQLDFVRGQALPEVQGFLFSRPVPPAELEQMLRSGTGLRA